MEINYRQFNLTIEQKVAIATDYNAGMPIAEIMEKYKVSRATIYRTLKTLVEDLEKGGETNQNGE